MRKAITGVLAILVAMSMTLIAMSGMTNVESKPVVGGGKPPSYYPYYGGNIFNIHEGTNLITFWCKPLITNASWPNGAQMTAKWVTDNAYSAMFGHQGGYYVGGGENWYHMIRWMVKYPYGTNAQPITYDVNLANTNNFLIEAGVAYGVYGWMGNINGDDIVIPIPGGVCAHYWNIAIPMNYDIRIGAIYNGFQMYTPPSNPYDGQTYGENASDVWARLKLPNGPGPYIGTGSLSCWNVDTQAWQEYNPSVPGSNFIIWQRTYDAGTSNWEETTPNAHDGWSFHLNSDGRIDGYCP
jgi:hypothetical protein